MVEESATVVPTFDRWPDALHICVLRHLGGPQLICGYVWPYRTLCRACASAALSPSLWREVDLSTIPNGLTMEQLHALLRRYCLSAVEHLRLNNLISCDDALVEVVDLLVGSPIRALDLGGCAALSGASLMVLCRLTDLEELGLECSIGLRDEHLASLCRGLPKLSRLDVRFCEWLTDVSALVIRPYGWRALQLDGCFRLDVERLLFMAPESWRSLHELGLDGEELNAQSLALIAQVCPNLRSLTVSFAKELDVIVLSSLASLRGLTGLTLKKATKPSDAEWAEFLVAHSSARTSAVDVEADQERTLQWEILNFAECEHFADEALAALASAPQPSLLELDLSWCWHVTDFGIRAVLEVSPVLQRLRLAGNKALTGGGLVPCCRLHRLEELDCTSCNSVADGFLDFLHRLFAAPPPEASSGSPGDEVDASVCSGSRVADCSCGSTSKPVKDSNKESPKVLPCVSDLPARIARCAVQLWRRRSRAMPRLRIKNYYGVFLEEEQDWAKLGPPERACSEADALFAELGEYGVESSVLAS